MAKENNENSNKVEMSKDEQIGFHKGSINTLMAERNEMVRIISVTENLINVHVKELEKLGIKLTEKEKDNKSV